MRTTSPTCVPWSRASKAPRDPQRPLTSGGAWPLANPPPDAARVRGFVLSRCAKCCEGMKRGVLPISHPPRSATKGPSESTLARGWLSPIVPMRGVRMRPHQCELRKGCVQKGEAWPAVRSAGGRCPYRERAIESRMSRVSQPTGQVWPLMQRMWNSPEE